AGPELEAPTLEILGRSPGQCKLRQSHTFVIERGKRVENRRGRDCRGRIEHADFQRIETGDIELKPDGDAAALLLGAGGCGKQRDAKSRHKKYTRKRARTCRRSH